MKIKEVLVPSNKKSKRKKSSTRSNLKSRIEIARKNKSKRRKNHSPIDKLKAVFGNESSGKKGRKSTSGKVHWKKRVVQIGLVSAAIFLFIGAVGTVWAISFIQGLNDDLPSLEAPFGKKPVATEIYARDGETLLYRVFDEFNADPVNIDEIPDHVKWAFLAAEDADFYTHPGFDVKGITNCAFANITSGETQCGGSTVTQQVLKNTVFNQEDNAYIRKIKEILMATRIEQAYSKDEILQLYLTVTNYGSNVTGIVTASDFYFDKEPKDLTFAEAAILASIVNEPSSLSPTVPLDGNIERAQEAANARKNYIIAQTQEKKNRINNQIRENRNDDSLEDVFTDEFLQEARDQELEYKPPVATNIKAGHFVDFVINQLQQRNYKNGEEPFTREDLNVSGYKIITSLDYEQQEKAEEATADGGTNYTAYGVHNAALLTIDPKNGEILAMSGSKNYFGEQEGCREYTEAGFGIECRFDPQVNVLTSLNEPGSTAKTIAYALAFEDGLLYGGSNIPDVPITYPGINYDPKNWDGSYYGEEVTVRSALVNSRNITALQVIEMISIDRYVDTLINLGYTTVERSQVGPSVVLGGASVKYTEHTAAYGMFGNGGNYVDLEPVLSIETSDGEQIYASDPQPIQVLSEQSTYLATDILFNLQNIVGETNVSLSCKTGTTENNIEALQVCWNDDQVTLAWAGNNNNDPLDPATGYPVFAVQPWLSPYFRNIYSLAYYQGQQTKINPPGYLFQGNGCSSDSEGCVSTATDWLIEGKVPPAYIETKEFEVCTDQPTRLARDIDVALGFATKKEFKRYVMPASRWQEDLDNYLAGKSKPNKYPSENCTVDRSGGASGPVLNITSPSSGASFTNSISVKGKAFATSGTLTGVSFRLNGSEVGSTTNYANFSVNVSVPSGLEEGTYSFEVVATDSNGDSSTYTTDVVKGDGETTNVSYVLPPSPFVSGGTAAITLNYSGAGTATAATLYQVDGSGTVTEIGAMSGGSSNFSTTWGSTAEAGKTYRFYAILTLNNGGSTKSVNSSSVTVN